MVKKKKTSGTNIGERSNIEGVLGLGGDLKLENPKKKRPTGKKNNLKGENDPSTGNLPKRGGGNLAKIYTKGKASPKGQPRMIYRDSAARGNSTWCAKRTADETRKKSRGRTGVTQNAAAGKKTGGGPGKGKK